MSHCVFSTLVLDAVSSAYADEGESGPVGFALDDSLNGTGIIANSDTGFRMLSFTDGNGGYLLSFAGTEGAQDAFADLKLGWSQWENVRGQVLDYLAAIDAKAECIYFAGHSLGGALAQYAFYEYVYDQKVALNNDNSIQLGLTTFNALGGQDGLYNYLPSYVAFMPELVSGVNADIKHYFIDGDIISRLGGGHLGGNTYVLRNVTDEEQRPFDFVTGHGIQTIYDLVSSPNGFQGDIEQSPEYLQISNIQRIAAGIGNLFNGLETGPIESKQRLAAALIGTFTLVTKLPGSFPGSGELNTLAKAVFTNLRDASDSDGMLTDVKRAAFGALADINWEFVFARIPPQVPALVTSLLLFAAVATDILEVALEQLQELVLPDAVAQEIREMVLLNAPLREFLDEYYGDSSEALDALLGNRGHAPDVYVGDVTIEEGQGNTLTISLLDRPAKEGGEAIVLSVSDPNRVTLDGPSVSVLDPRSGRYRLVVPEGLTGLQILVEAHGDVDGQDNTVLIQAQSIPFSELGEEFRDVYLGTGRVEISDSAESVSENLILGSEHDDQALVGTPASDEIRGFGGDDGINGNFGDDLLEGGAGADIIRGEEGDDELDGGAGRDVLKGGLGEDVLYGGTDSDAISGANGNDYLSGGEGGDLLAGGAGTDLLDGGPGSDDLWGDGTYEASNRQWTMARIVDQEGVVQHEYESVVGSAWSNDDQRDVILGGDGNDSIWAGGGDDAVFGEGDDDYIEAGAGVDLLDGGEGNDQLHGGYGDDQLYGGDGNDHLNGDGADHYSSGIEGNDYLDGGAGDDELQGGRGNDTLFGGSGNNLLFGDDGDDQLHGGDDNDELQGNGGNDILYGGGGNDILAGAGHGDHTTSQDGDDYLNGGAGDDSLNGDEGRDTLLGDAGNDILVGGPAEDFLFGGDGADYLLGDEDGDFLDGGAERDELNGGEGNDIIHGGDGDDIGIGEDGDDELHGDQGDDQIQGNGGSDALYGGLGNDLLFGAGAADYMHSPDGDDYLDGGEGEDVLAGGDGSDTLMGGAGNDVIAGEQGDDTLHGQDGDDNLQGNDGADFLYGGEGNDALFGLEGNDLLDGGVGEDELQGGAGRDVVFGREGNDLMFGDAGSDDLIGGEGSDELQGGEGDDLLSGEAGSDRLYGQDGNDVLAGGAGVGIDQLAGGAGDDTYRYELGNGRDYITDAEGNDRIEFGAGITLHDLGFAKGSVSGNPNPWFVLNVGDKDSIWIENGLEGAIETLAFSDGSTLSLEIALGTEDDDTIDGSADGDIIWSEAGDDLIDGGGGQDIIIAGTGDDSLIGGLGDDSLDGGWGSDTYYYNLGDGSDRIRDLGDGMDTDRLVFGEGISVTDFQLAVPEHRLDIVGNDLTIRVGNGPDTLTFVNMLDPKNTSTTDGRIDSFAFADGTVLGVDDVLSGLGSGIENLGSAGSDSLHGHTGDDTLRGLDGDDWLTGYEGDDLLIGGKGRDHLDGDVHDYEGANISGDDTLDGGAGDDHLNGGNGDDILSGGSGNDELEAGPGNDVIDGGVGDDLLKGYMGRDVYHFGRGSGSDVIFDDAFAIDDSTWLTFRRDDFDTIRIGQGVTADDLQITREDNDLKIRIEGTDDVLTIDVGSDSSGWDWAKTGAYNIEQIEFSDGSEIDTNIFQDLPNFVYGTEGDDRLRAQRGYHNTLEGYGGDDDLHGGTNDALIGGTGDDTYHIDQYVSEDVIDDVAGDDRILFSSTVDPAAIQVERQIDDLVIALNAGGRVTIAGWFAGNVIENLEFYDGTIWSAADLEARAAQVQNRPPFVANALDDQTVVMDGSVHFEIPADTFGDPDAGDVLTYSAALAGSSVLPEWLEFDADTRIFTGVPTEQDIGTLELLVTATDSGGLSVFESFALAVEQAPDAEPIVGSKGDDVLGGTASDDLIKGRGGNDTLNGGAGDDTLRGNSGHDTLIGEMGNDTLVGAAGDDALSGGAGDDALTGGSGADTYLFGRGDGHDVINDFNSQDSEIEADRPNDRIEFADDVSASDIEYSRSGADLVLGIVGSDDSLTLRNWFKGEAYRVEELVFADGSALPPAEEIYRELLTLTGSEGEDTLKGSRWDETLSGFAGDDVLRGQGGADTLFGHEGSDRLYGGSGDDTLAGGAGDDTLVGGRGSDNYVFGVGDGQDRIKNYNRFDADPDTYGAAVDRVLFGDGLTLDDLDVVRGGDDLEIGILGTDDRLSIRDWYVDQTHRVEEFHFDDGTVVLETQVEQLVAAMAAFGPDGSAEADFASASGQEDQAMVAANWEAA